MNKEIQSISPDLALMQVEIDTQIATAKKYPRNIQQFLTNASAMIKNNPKLAQDCSYSLTRKSRNPATGQYENSIISGPSIRMAEIAMNTWGNLRNGAKVMDHDGKSVCVHAFTHDLETNNRIDLEVRRSILTKKGKIFSQDMIQTTEMAAVSIGVRNTLFKIIPRSYIDSLMDIAKEAAMGPSNREREFKDGWIAYFEKLGISKERLFAKFEAKNEASMTRENWKMVPGLAAAIRDGQTTIETEFPTPDQQEPPTLTTDEKRAKIDDAIKDCKDEIEFEQVYKDSQKLFWFDNEADEIFKEQFNNFLSGLNDAPAE